MLQALTASWAIWSEGVDNANGDWRLCASRLPGTRGQVAAPMLLARNATFAGNSSPDAPVQFTGLWASSVPTSGSVPVAGDDTVLITALTRDGTSKLLRIDFAGGQPAVRVVARASAPGRLLTSPSWDGNTYLWSEVWVGADAHLYSTIWHGEDAGHAQPLTGDDSAFAPRSTGGTLLWVQGEQNAAITQTNSGGSAADGDLAVVARAVAAVRGALDARPLSGGPSWQVASGVEVGTVQAAGPFVLWGAGDGGTSANAEHAYDLRGHAASAANSQVRAAHFADTDGMSLTWGERSGAIAVMDR